MRIKRVLIYSILSVVILLTVGCIKNSFFVTEPKYVVSTIPRSTWGFDGATDTYAKFYAPTRGVVDIDGSIIVPDTFINHRIQKIDSNGVVTTIAGSSYGYAKEGSSHGYADGIGTNAKFYWPRVIGIDKDRAIIVTDRGNHRIRKIDTNGEVSTIAGSSYGYADGLGKNAKFISPNGGLIDNDGSIIVVETDNHRIRKIDSNGVVSTLAGSTKGYADGIGINAQFDQPSDLAIDKDRAIIVVDQGNHRIRKIDSNGVVSTIAGSTKGYADGVGINAQFDQPSDLAIDKDGVIIVADKGNHRIRKIDSNGVVSTIAGSARGYADGIGTYAKFSFPNEVGINKDGSINVAELQYNQLRKIDSIKR